MTERRRTRPFLPMVAAIAGLASIAESQQAGDTVPVRLPPIEVFTSILPASGPAVASLLPARSTIISGASLENWKPPLLSNALSAAAGFSVYDDLGSRSKTTAVSRGFTVGPVVGLPQGLTVFIDGVPVNEPDARQVSFDLLPTAHASRIELLSGTATLLGPNSLGGAINLVTRHGSGAAGGDLEIGHSSYGGRDFAADIKGSAGGWRYYGGATTARETGWRDATALRRSDLFLNAGRQGAMRGFNVQAHGARSYAETAGSLPLSVYEENPRLNLTAGDFEDLSQAHVAFAAYTAVAGGRTAFNLYLRAHDAERFNVNQTVDPDVRSFSTNRTAGATADWRWDGVVNGATLSVRLGGSGSVNRSEVEIFAERLDPGMTTHVRSPILESGAFTAADWHRGRTTISVGARLDRVRLPFRNLLNPARDTTSIYTQLNPRAGVTVDVGHGASLYASIGRSFRAPALIELACADPSDPCPLPFALGDDPPLNPVTALTHELGARLQRGDASLAVSAFRTSLRNEIFLYPYVDDAEPQGSTIDGYFANIDATRREGMEAEARMRLSGNASGYVNYAWTRATFQVDGVELFSAREHAGAENEIERGDRLPLVPDHAWRAGIDARLPRGTQIGFAGRYTGRRYLRGDEANEEAPLAGHFVADARAARDFGRWRVSVVVHNLADTRYETFGTFNVHQEAGGVVERFLTPGQPRSYHVSVRIRFGSQR